MTFRRVGAQRDVLGESPIWDADTAALFWVGIRHPAVCRLDGPGGVVETRDTPAASCVPALRAGTVFRLDAPPLRPVPSSMASSEF